MCHQTPVKFSILASLALSQYCQQGLFTLVAPGFHVTLHTDVASSMKWMAAAQSRAFLPGVVYYNCKARNISWNLHFSHIWDSFQLKPSSPWNPAFAAPEFNSEAAEHNFHPAPGCDTMQADHSNPTGVLHRQDVSECRSPNKGEWQIYNVSLTARACDWTNAVQFGDAAAVFARRPPHVKSYQKCHMQEGCALPGSGTAQTTKIKSRTISGWQFWGGLLRGRVGTHTRRHGRTHEAGGRSCVNSSTHSHTNTHSHPCKAA